MKFSKQKTELPNSEQSNKLSFLAPNQSKNDYNSLSQSLQTVSCKKTFSSEHLCSPTLKAQPPTPCAKPSLSLCLPHMQHAHLLPPVRLWFSTFSSILPPAACTFLCSPTSPQFQQLSRETSPFPLTAAPAAHRAAPAQLSHP